MRKVGIAVLLFSTAFCTALAAFAANAWGAADIKTVIEIAPPKLTPEQVKEAKKKDPNWVEPLPTIRVLIKSALPNLKKDDFKLKIQEERDPPVEPTAVSAQPFKDSNEDMAVVILVQGNERFMGNMSTIDADGTPRDPSPGAYDDVK